jgi:hypothetical protein
MKYETLFQFINAYCFVPRLACHVDLLAVNLRDRSVKQWQIALSNLSVAVLDCLLLSLARGGSTLVLPAFEVAVPQCGRELAHRCLLQA